ncbi:hypothetical protein [Kitasatospora purpeofusca]|uniref:hypothetical protein n=1 Tax=Kitasatospora purpeofusca TaxID=67352 RepID=UPI0012FEB99A|nr:hypothetical protein [Kitasatospora purpeofusca]
MAILAPVEPPPADGRWRRRVPPSSEYSIPLLESKEIPPSDNLKFRQKPSHDGTAAANAESGEQSNESPSIRNDGVSRLVQTTSQIPAQGLAAE